MAAAALAGGLRAADAAGNKACLECHGDPKLGIWKGGKMVSLHVDTSGFGRSAHASLGCTDCHDAVDLNVRPHHRPAAAVDCRGCHDATAKTHAFHADFAAVPFAATAETDCTSCHGTHGIPEASGAKSSFAGAKLVAACGECHADVAEHFMNSAHGAAFAAGRAEAPTCLTCHMKPVAAGSDKLKLKREQTDLCLSCHRDESRVLAASKVSRGFIVSYGESVHGKSLAQGTATEATRRPARSAPARGSTRRISPGHAPSATRRRPRSMR